MFVYSLKASSIRFFSVLSLSLVALITLIALIPTIEPTAASTLYSPVAKIDFHLGKTNEDRIAFLAQFGWTVAEQPICEQQIRIPSEFDRIFVRYNNLQKQQGLDLGRCKRKTVTRYTYTVTNYPDASGTVWANLLVYRGRIVGGDICSAEAGGFVRGFDGVMTP